MTACRSLYDRRVNDAETQASSAIRRYAAFRVYSSSGRMTLHACAFRAAPVPLSPLYLPCKLVLSSAQVGNIFFYLPRKTPHAAEAMDASVNVLC
jgi:hypothetical protein